MLLRQCRWRPCAAWDGPRQPGHLQGAGLLAISAVAAAACGCCRTRGCIGAGSCGWPSLSVGVGARAAWPQAFLCCWLTPWLCCICCPDLLHRSRGMHSSEGVETAVAVPGMSHVLGAQRVRGELPCSNPTRPPRTCCAVLLGTSAAPPVSFAAAAAACSSAGRVAHNCYVGWGASGAQTAHTRKGRRAAHSRSGCATQQPCGTCRTPSSPWSHRARCTHAYARAHLFSAIPDTACGIPLDGSLLARHRWIEFLFAMILYCLSFHRDQTSVERSTHPQNLPFAQTPCYRFDMHMIAPL